MGSLLLACGGQAARVFDPHETGRLAPEPTIVTDEQSHCARWNHTGKCIALCGSKGRIRLYHRSGDAIPGGDLPLFDTRGSPLPCTTFRFTKGSRFIIAAGAADEALMYDLKMRRVERAFQARTGTHILATALTPCDKYLAASFQGGPVSVFMVHSALEVAQLGDEEGVAKTALEYHPTERHQLAVGSQSGTVRVVDTMTTRTAALLPAVHTAPVTGVAWASPYPATLISSGGHSVTISDLRVRGPAARIATPGACTALASSTAVSPECGRDASDPLVAVGTREGGILVYDIRMAASGPLAEAPSFLPGVVASLDWQRPPLQRASPAQEAAGTTGAGEPQAARGPRGDEVGPGQREHGRLDMTGVSDMVSYSGAEEGPREGHRVGGGAAQRGSICGARRNGGGAEGAGEVQTLQVEGGLEGEEGRGLRSAERAKSAGAGEREKVQQGMQRGDVGAPRVVHVGLTEEEVRRVVREEIGAAVGSLREEMRESIKELGVEMIRQLHYQRVELAGTWEELRGENRADLGEVSAVLRGLMERLRH